MSPADIAAVVAPAVRKRCGDIPIPIVSRVICAIRDPTLRAVIGPRAFDEIHKALEGGRDASSNTGRAPLR